jgi:rhodanese-related sulfurtransferase
MRNAKLDLDDDESVASARVLGLFNSNDQHFALYLNFHDVGVYSRLTKEHTVFSVDGDFFEAGMRFVETKREDNASDVRPFAPPRLSLKIPSSNQVVTAEPEVTPDSPSFFSPAFAEHLSTSNRRPDPRIHTANIPLHSTSPVRSQTFPTTPGPISISSTSYSLLNGKQGLRTRPQSEVPSANVTPITPAELSILLKSRKLLVIDIRSFSAYAKGRMQNAINVCIPTVLLKRSTLSLEDIAESIVSKGDRDRFAQWKDVDGIVIYDADSLRVNEAYPLATLAGKFTETGFSKASYGLIGTRSLTQLIQAASHP